MKVEFNLYENEELIASGWAEFPQNPLTDDGYIERIQYINLQLDDKALCCKVKEFKQIRPGLAKIRSEWYRGMPSVDCLVSVYDVLDPTSPEQTITLYPVISYLLRLCQ